MKSILISPFSTGFPYFLRSREDGELHSKARVAIQGLANGATGKAAPASARLALHDLLCAEEGLCESENEDQLRLLSEAVLSAIALGVEIAGSKDASLLMAERGRKGADALHNQLNRERKAKALQWYEQHRGKFPDKDSAAAEMANLFHVSFHTARDWLKVPRKSR